MHASHWKTQHVFYWVIKTFTSIATTESPVTHGSLALCPHDAHGCQEPGFQVIASDCQPKERVPFWLLFFFFFLEREGEQTFPFHFHKRSPEPCLHCSSLFLDVQIQMTLVRLIVLNYMWADGFVRCHSCLPNASPLVVAVAVQGCA